MNLRRVAGRTRHVRLQILRNDLGQDADHACRAIGFERQPEHIFALSPKGRDARGLQIARQAEALVGDIGCGIGVAKLDEEIDQSSSILEIRIECREIGAVSAGDEVREQVMRPLVILQGTARFAGRTRDISAIDIGDSQVVMHRHGPGLAQRRTDRLHQPDRGLVVGEGSTEVAAIDLGNTAVLLRSGQVVAHRNRPGLAQHGPAGVGSLARLASTFSGDEAVEVYDRISGFAPRIQDEILKRSDGDLAAIADLVEEAQEGAFNIRRCGAGYSCEIIRDIVQRRLSQSDFEILVGEATSSEASPSSDVGPHEAARAFWKALAVG